MLENQYLIDYYIIFSIKVIKIRVLEKKKKIPTTRTESFTCHF